MANNNYGPPPLPQQMISNGVSHPYYYPQQQQQHQSERISGDGEEVYRYDYLRPANQGPMPSMPNNMVPPMPPISGATTGVTYNYDNVNPLGANSYEQFEYAPTQFQMQPLEIGVAAEGEGQYASLQENRSVDGEEQLLNYNNGPISMPEMVLTNSVPLSSVGGHPAQPPTIPTLDSYQPLGIETPQAFQTVNQEQRCETIGSAMSQHQTTAPMPSQTEDFRESGGYHSLDSQSDIAPRSIEGQEFREELISPPGGPAINPSFNTNLYSAPSNNNIAPSQEQRSQAIGSEVGVDQHARSIEGQEQIQTDTTGASSSVGGMAHGTNTLVVSSTTLPTHHRSETLGSDTVHGEHRLPPKSKPSGSKAVNTNSGSETGESAGRGSRDDARRRRQTESDANKGRSKDKRGEAYDRRENSHRSHKRHPSFDEDGSEDDDYGGKQYDRRRERDQWEDSRKNRPRGKESDRERSRRGDEWESVSTRGGDSIRNYGRDYEFDDYRPRSRNSSYHDPDDYYERRRHHRDHDTRARGNDYQQRPYPRERRPPIGYMDHGAPYNSLGRSQYGYQDPYAQKTPIQAHLERLRVENPVQYLEWYKKFTAHQKDKSRPFPAVPGYSGPTTQQPQTTVAAGNTERPRVQSGRSSVVDDASSTLGQEDSRFRPVQENCDPTPARMTPQKFSVSHSIGMLTPLGHLVRVRNGGSVVEILNIKPLMKRAPEFKEVKMFPGPLVKNITHKNTIVQFCQRKVRELEINEDQLDRENLILLWELLILLLRQNGSTVGSDFAELLLKSKSTGRSSDSISDHESDENEADRTEPSNAVTGENEQKCIEAFCDKLLYGHKKEALDYAMDNGLWGHALFFASKMEERIYLNVLARFANGMAINSPLQTLYQVLGGKQPASVTCCCDDSFGDWKPHLAMILSNAGQRPEVEAKAITTFGDTLGNRGFKFASQFCYLMAAEEFAADSKLGPLLGFNPALNNILEATQMTEIYEFARSLGTPDFTLGTSFVESKLNYTRTLLGLGFVQEAYMYCEELTKSLLKGRIYQKERTIAWNILQIAERLVNCDVARSTGEPSWIQALRKIVDEAESGTDSRKLSFATSTSDNVDDTAQLGQYNNDGYSAKTNTGHQNGMTLESSSLPPIATKEIISAPSLMNNVNANSNQWNQNQPSSLPNYVPPALHDYSSNQEPGSLQQQMPAFQNIVQGNVAHSQDPYNNNYLQPYGSAPKFNPNISSAGQGPNSGSYSNSKTENVEPKPLHPTQKPSPKQLNKKTDLSSLSGSQQQKKGKGWLSGMISKLSFKPDNQMILPDDSKPTIVWDAATKTWKNTLGEEDEDSAPKGPPPRDSDLMQPRRGSASNPPPIRENNVPAANPMIPSAHSQQPLSNSLPQNTNPTNPQPIGMNGGPRSLAAPPNPSNQQNKYQRTKGISLRNNYVDVFNPNSQRTNSQEPTVPLPVAPTGPGMPNIFMPNPVSSSADSGPTSFLSTPDQFPNSNEESNDASQPPPPQMFNPAQFQNHNINNYNVNR